MKKVLSSMLIVAAITASSTISVQALNFEKERGKISVNTQANTEIAPDVVEISFTVKTSDYKSMQNATMDNKEISDKVLGVLKSMIDNSNGDYIKTSDFTAQPIYSYQNSKKVFDKYEVSNRVIVHTKSIDKVGLMIDNAIKSGATNVENLSFSVSDYESQCNDLITIATQKARTRAEITAKALGSSLDGVSSIVTSCSTNNYNPPRFYMAKNMIADTAAEISSTSGATTISNGVIKVNASVNANFFVKE